MAGNMSYCLVNKVPDDINKSKPLTMSTTFAVEIAVGLQQLNTTSDLLA